MCPSCRQRHFVETWSWDQNWGRLPSRSCHQMAMSVQGLSQDPCVHVPLQLGTLIAGVGTGGALSPLADRSAFPSPGWKSRLCLF